MYETMALLVYLATATATMEYNAPIVEASEIVQNIATTTAPTIPVERIWRREDIDELIDTKALEYGVSAPLMRHIVGGESTYNRYAKGDRDYVCKKTGQVSPSYGLAQINLCFHTVTREEAESPEFAVDFLAQNIKAGRCRLWSTCPNRNAPD